MLTLLICFCKIYPPCSPHHLSVLYLVYSHIFSTDCGVWPVEFSECCIACDDVSESSVRYTKVFFLLIFISIWDILYICFFALLYSTRADSINLSLTCQRFLLLTYEFIFARLRRLTLTNQPNKPVYLIYLPCLPSGSTPAVGGGDRYLSTHPIDHKVCSDPFSFPG